jgi:hypothetical protein
VDRTPEDDLHGSKINRESTASSSLLSLSVTVPVTAFALGMLLTALFRRASIPSS